MSTNITIKVQKTCRNPLVLFLDKFVQNPAQWDQINFESLETNKWTIIKSSVFIHSTWVIYGGADGRKKFAYGDAFLPCGNATMHNCTSLKFRDQQVAN